MTTDSEPSDAPQQRLSALMDGELEASATAHPCDRWHVDARSRADWHAYHLIGDVLRSEDLASDPAHDAAFLAAFRARIATEPVVLAPRPLESTVDRSTRRAGARRWAWMAPSAVAAGFVAVAGVVVLTRGPSTLPSRDAAASLAQGAPAVVQTASSQMAAASMQAALPSGEPQIVIANGQLIRDARLDRYLDAHKQFAGSSALGVPSGFLRSATAVDLSDR